jgi:type IV secretion system protein VirD4
MPRPPLASLATFARGTLQAIQIAQALTSSAHAEPPPPDRMAGFAPLDLLYGHAMRSGAFPLGLLHPDHGESFPVGIADDRHLFVMAGTRSGKGLTLGIPAALTWEGPIFAIDPKGEMASHAALRRATADAAKGTGTSVRAFLGQQVAILDPLGQVRGPARAFKVAYNPLADIDMNKGGGVRSIRAAASSIITPDDGNGKHFTETAETLLAGVIEAVKLKEPANRQTLSQCRAVLLAGFDALLGYLQSVETAAGLASEAAAIAEEVGGDEWGSFRSTLSRNLKWLADPEMSEHVTPSAFSLRKAIQNGWSVFVVLPPEEIANFKGWLRLVVRTVLDAKMQQSFTGGGPHTLCLLDEFPTLGHFELLKESAGYMAGYGLKLVPIIQNISQLKEHYPKNWETFLGNAGAIIAFGLNDLETENYLADRLGKIAAIETSVGHNVGGLMQSGRSINTARHDRPIRFPNEIRAEGARETGRAFVIPASGAGFTILRQPYHETFPAHLFDSREHIAAWETKHWGNAP